MYVRPFATVGIPPVRTAEFELTDLWPIHCIYFRAFPSESKDSFIKFDKESISFDGPDQLASNVQTYAFRYGASSVVPFAAVGILPVRTEGPP